MRRFSRFSALLAMAFWTLVTLPATAGAYVGQNGDPRPLGTVNEILIFGVGPIGVFLLLGLLTMRPGRGSPASRYRPGREWPHPAQWFGTADGEQPESTTASPSPGHGGARGSW